MTQQRAVDSNSWNGGFIAMVQHFWERTKMPAPQSGTAFLRGQVSQTRTRFMDSIATGKPDAGAAEKYMSAVKQYRVAIFAEAGLRRSGGKRRTR